MAEPLARDEPGCYRILIQGHLTASLADWLGGMDLQVSRDESGQALTTLSGIVTDQAQLHGILMRIRDLGLPLLLVEMTGPPAMEQDNETKDDPG